MLVFSSEQTRQALCFDALIPILREAFKQGAHVPARHVHTVASQGGLRVRRSSCLPGMNKGISAHRHFPAE